MNKEKLAELLDGKTEVAISKSIEKTAKEAGLVIVYGASDDCIEFRGAIHDAGSCYDGGEVLFTKKGVLQNQEECEDAIDVLKENGYNTDCLQIQSNKINAIWGDGLYSWQYETEIPHVTFDIMEDGELYCKGIIFDLKDLK